MNKHCISKRYQYRFPSWNAIHTAARESCSSEEPIIRLLLDFLWNIVYCASEDFKQAFPQLNKNWPPATKRFFSRLVRTSWCLWIFITSRNDAFMTEFLKLFNSTGRLCARIYHFIRVHFLWRGTLPIFGFFTSCNSNPTVVAVTAAFYNIECDQLSRLVTASGASVEQGINVIELSKRVSKNKQLVTVVVKRLIIYFHFFLTLNVEGIKFAKRHFYCSLKQLN